VIKKIVLQGNHVV